MSAITVNRAEKHWEVNKSACILCGTCESKCPKQAITLNRNAKRPAAAAARKSLHCQFPYREAKVFLLVNEKMCAGCSSCVFACCLSREGVAAPNLSRIKVDNIRYEEWDNLAKPCFAVRRSPMHALLSFAMPFM